MVFENPTGKKFELKSSTDSAMASRERTTSTATQTTATEQAEFFWKKPAVPPLTLRLVRQAPSSAKDSKTTEQKSEQLKNCQDPVKEKQPPETSSSQTEANNVAAASGCSSKGGKANNGTAVSGCSSKGGEANIDADASSCSFKVGEANNVAAASSCSFKVGEANNGAAASGCSSRARGGKAQKSRHGTFQPKCCSQHFNGHLSKFVEEIDTVTLQREADKIGSGGAKLKSDPSSSQGAQKQKSKVAGPYKAKSKLYEKPSQELRNLTAKYVADKKLSYELSIKEMPDHSLFSRRMYLLKIFYTKGVLNWLYTLFAMKLTPGADPRLLVVMANQYIGLFLWNPFMVTKLYDFMTAEKYTDKDLDDVTTAFALYELETAYDVPARYGDNYINANKSDSSSSCSERFSASNIKELVSAAKAKKRSSAAKTKKRSSNIRDSSSDTSPERGSPNESARKRKVYVRTKRRMSDTSSESRSVAQSNSATLDSKIDGNSSEWSTVSEEHGGCSDEEIEPENSDEFDYDSGDTAIVPRRTGAASC